MSTSQTPGAAEAEWYWLFTASTWFCSHTDVYLRGKGGARKAGNQTQLHATKGRRMAGDGGRPSTAQHRNQKNTNKSSHLHTKENWIRGSCKQVAALKQYSWISSSYATIIITPCLRQRREAPAPNSLRFPRNTNQAGSTNSSSVMLHFNTKIWQQEPRYRPNMSGEPESHVQTRV